MEWITKLVNVLKIPLKILLPAICIFSGFLLFASDNLLVKINLLDWKTKNGFIFGLLFLISLSLISVYVIYFIKNEIARLWFCATANHKVIKQIIELNAAEQAILALLYKSPLYTHSVDFNQPIVKGLISRGYIFAGDSQRVRASVFNSALPINATLQPYVRIALDKYLPVFRNKIQKYEVKISKAKSEKKKTHLKVYQENMKNFCGLFEQGE